MNKKHLPIMTIAEVAEYLPKVPRGSVYNFAQQTMSTWLQARALTGVLVDNPAFGRPTRGQQRGEQP